MLEYYYRTGEPLAVVQKKEATPATPFTFGFHFGFESTREQHVCKKQLKTGLRCALKPVD